MNGLLLFTLFGLTFGFALELMKRPRKPLSQLSPYERRLMSHSKMPKPQEQCSNAKEQEATGGVQGCGDPDCQICMPKGRPQDAGGAKFTPPDMTATEIERMRARSDEVDREMRSARAAAIDREIYERLRQSVFSGVVVFDTAGAASEKPGPADRERQKARAAEQALRPKVERFFLQAQHAVGWDEVIGNDTARAALIEAIEHPVKFKTLYAHYRKKPTKGVCLYGPPGCGKTMFGKAAASALATLHGGKSDVTLLHIKGPEIQSPYIGVTEEIIRNIFAYARAYKALHGYPLVVFIDEADAILPSRDGGNGRRRALPWEESNVATFLTEMDGLEESGALVILATNRPQAIDAALLRDGRCDRKIKVERPTREAATVIFTRCLAGVPLQVTIDGPMREDTCREDMARYAADCLFAGHRRLLAIQSEKGLHYLTLGDIVNGAMVGGIVEQAKAKAFARDLETGSPSGLTIADLEAAIDAVVQQNTGLDHAYALGEFVERLGCRFAQCVPLTMGHTPIVHEGTETRQ